MFAPFLRCVSSWLCYLSSFCLLLRVTLSENEENKKLFFIKRCSTSLLYWLVIQIISLKTSWVLVINSVRFGANHAMLKQATYKTVFFSLSLFSQC